MSPQLHWCESQQSVSGRLALWHWPNAYQTTLPIRGYVWLIHGFAEHALRYNELANFLTQVGYDVLALDLVGHGMSRSAGGMASLQTFDFMLKDFRAVQSFWYLKGPHAKAGAHQKEAFLVAHSMGSLLSIKHLISDWADRGPVPEFKKCFLSAPPLELKLPVPEWKRSLANILLKSTPNLKLDNELKSEQMTRDSVIVYDHSQDKDIFSYATPKFFVSMEESAADLKQRAAEVEIPTCLSVGDDDPIVNPQSVINFYERLSTHKKLLKFPGNFHENFNELNRKVIYRECVEWML